MSAGSESFALLLEYGQCGRQFSSGVGWVDDGIDETSIGGNIGIEQPGLVGVFKFESFFEAGSAMQDLNRAFGAHHGDLGRGPCE